MISKSGLLLADGCLLFVHLDWMRRLLGNLLGKPLLGQQPRKMCQKWGPITSGNQTWLAGKSTIYSWSIKSSVFLGGFSSQPCFIHTFSCSKHCTLPFWSCASLSKSAASWVEENVLGLVVRRRFFSPKSRFKISPEIHQTSSDIIRPVLVHFLQIGGLHVLFQRLILVEALPQFLVLDVPRIEVLSSAGSLENVDPWKARGW